MMIESSKSIVQIHGLLLRQSFLAVWTSSIFEQMNVTWDKRLLFSHQNLNDITTENRKYIENQPNQTNDTKETYRFVCQKKHIPQTHTPLHPVSSTKERKNTLRGWTNQVFFVQLFNGVSPRRGMLERRLGTHQQTALGRLGSFGSGVLGGEFLSYGKTGGFPLRCFVGVV